jgi:DNA-binding CsgD family transcriptional regulator
MSLSAMVDYNLANLSGLRFETAKALDAATRCIETARQLGARRLEALGWVTAGQAHGNRGDRGKARLAADEARRALPGDPETEGLAAGMCESWAALMMGDVDGAAEGYGRSLETLAALPVPTATAPWYVGTTLLAAVDHPFAGTARAHLEAPSFRAATGLGAVSTLIDAVVAGRTAGAAEADELLIEVRRHHRQHPELIANLAGLWHVLWATVASAELRDGWGRPIEDLKQAEQWLQDHGSEPAARWCASQLRAAGVAPRRRGRSRADVPDMLERFGVTKREHEVLLLLGGRLTNREIADRMTVSPSTVKSHVERLLAKTGRRNRIELAELATATDGE